MTAKPVKLIFALLFISALSGCKKADTDVLARLAEMESYTAQADVTYISNKSTDTFTMMQYAKKDGRYRMETLAPQQYEGTALVYDGKLVWQKTEGEESRVKVTSNSPERSLLLLYSFLENHEKSMEDATVTTASTPRKNFTVLEADIPGDNKYLAREKLWIDNESGDPQKLVVYTSDGKEKIVVKFSDFRYNEKIEDTKFSVN